MAKSGWRQHAPWIISDIFFAGLLACGLFFLAEHREDERQAHLVEIEQSRADEADRRALQVGLTLDDSLDGLTLPDFDLAGLQLPLRSLVGANLSGSDLAGSDLHGVNLTGASLISTILRESDLRDTDMSDAVLNLADLRDANLEGVSFRGARLGGADLSKSNLTDVDFTGAQLSTATLVDVRWHEDEPPIWPAGFEPPSNAGFPHLRDVHPSTDPARFLTHGLLIGPDVRQVCSRSMSMPRGRRP